MAEDTIASTDIAISQAEEVPALGRFSFLVNNKVDHIRAYSQFLMESQKLEVEGFSELIRHEEVKDKHNNVILGLPLGVNSFIYNDTSIDITIYQESKVIKIGGWLDKWLSLYISIHIETYEEAHDLLNKFTDSAQTYYDEKLKAQGINIYNFNSQFGWGRISKLNQRALDTIYFDEEKKQKLIEDVKGFGNERDDYAKFGIPYKRNYLFYGPPGTGKTSFITALANILNKNIYSYNLTTGTDSDIITAMRGLDFEKSVFVLEDVDSIFIKKASETKISLSTMLNILDGFHCKSGLITFITANDISMLDAALLRVGRIDVKLEFTHASKAQIKQMYRRMIPLSATTPAKTDHFEKFFNIIKDKKMNMSLIQKFIFEHRNCSDLTEYEDELLKLISQHKDHDPLGIL